MSITIWLSFVAAALILCFSPGPTALLVMGKALNHGKKSVIPLVVGVLSGDIIAMSFSFIGLGAILSTSAALFGILKWVGAIYLIYLGIKTWRIKTHIPNDHSNIDQNLIWRDALIVTALNPKAIIFFMAFFPLFINTNEAFIPQMLILALTFLVTSAVSVSLYATFSGLLRRHMLRHSTGYTLANKGTDTRTLQHFLGHKNIQNTVIYTEMSAERFKKIWNEK